MNWRRGIALATIHLTVATTVSIRSEVDYWRFIRSERVRIPVPIPPTATAEEVMEANFYPCDEGGIIERAFTPRETLDGAANMPAVLLVGWHEPCAQPNALDRVVEKRYGRTRKAEVLILTIECAVFGVLWLLVGGYPLVQLRRWWLEPGAFITVCTIPAALASLLIPDGLAFQLSSIEHAAEVPSVVALLAWIWWLGLLILQSGRSAFRALVRLRTKVTG